VRPGRGKYNRPQVSSKGPQESIRGPQEYPLQQARPGLGNSKKALGTNHKMNGEILRQKTHGGLPNLHPKALKRKGLFTGKQVGAWGRFPVGQENFGVKNSGQDVR